MAKRIKIWTIGGLLCLLVLFIIPLFSCDNDLVPKVEPCNGNGRCTHCGGSGQVWVKVSQGGDEWHQWDECWACGGDGVCRKCNGKGCK
jgi:DnaJ-class molecular chaperone